jgi:hypothetical protein
VMLYLHSSIRLYGVVLSYAQGQPHIYIKVTGEEAGSYGSKHALNLKCSSEFVNEIFVSVVPKYLVFVTFSNDLLVIFVL